jgi:hypothetical protein
MDVTARMPPIRSFHMGNMFRMDWQLFSDLCVQEATAEPKANLHPLYIPGASCNDGMHYMCGYSLSLVISLGVLE